jgi:Transglutaminase-like superfamily
VSYVTPLDLERLPLTQRTRLGAEVLRTYIRVRWVMRDDDAQRAVARLRGRRDADARKLSEGEQFIAAVRLAHAAARVLHMLPTDSRCLFRSLTLMCLLERRGVDQTLVIAVRPQPFSAHAWLEVEGQAVLPDAEPGYERLLEL